MKMWKKVGWQSRSSVDCLRGQPSIQQLCGLLVLLWLLKLDIHIVPSSAKLGPRQHLEGQQDAQQQKSLQQDPPQDTMAELIPLAECRSFTALQKAKDRLEKLHLKTLLSDEHRVNLMIVNTDDGIYFDFSRQKLDSQGLGDLLSLAREKNIEKKKNMMFEGAKINTTENRAALHVALRMPQGSAPILVDKKDVLLEVHAVQRQIKEFVEKIRSGTIRGHTGKLLTNVISVGIGGSYLGTEFVYTALAAYSLAAKHAAGRSLHFLANVDPVDVYLSQRGFDPETTLVVVISKTFTTAETLMNAHSLREWFLKHYKGDVKALGAHFCAVSTNLEGTSKFGILPQNVFPFWDWVGGRYSVTSAVGLLPIALLYGWNIVSEFLEGAHAMDMHFLNTRLEENIPILMGLISIWNSTFLGHDAVAVLPYAQALLRFPAHVQQLTMESNGKRVMLDGTPLQHSAGEIYFGEPGTNGQHSFYQLIHQGRIIPCEFIGFCKSQQPLKLDNQALSNHDELMSNFFAQPDALAFGKDEAQLQKEGVPETLIPHKLFPGDRPSSQLLFPEASPYYIGQLLALYEHRTVVEGWIWGINSFDQWGVELGKALAKNVNGILQRRRSGVTSTESGEQFLCTSTKSLLNVYIEKSRS